MQIETRLLQLFQPIVDHLRSHFDGIVHEPEVAGELVRLRVQSRNGQSHELTASRDYLETTAVREHLERARLETQLQEHGVHLRPYNRTA